MKRLAVLITVVLMGSAFPSFPCLADQSNDYFNEGFAKQQSGEMKDAVSQYSRAIEANPGFVMAYLMRASAWQSLKQFNKAINDYTMVISQGEPYFQAVGYFNRGMTKNMSGDYQGAIPDFTSAIALDRKMAAAYFHRAISKSKTGDLAGRYEDFRQAARLGDTDAEKWLDRIYPAWRQPNPTPVAAPAPGLHPVI